MISINEIILFGNKELNAVLVYFTFGSMFVTLTTTILWRTAKRKAYLQKTDLGLLEQQLEVKKGLLKLSEQDLQYEREQTTKYWLDKASKDIPVEEGLAQEYRPDVLQDGMKNIGPSMHSFFLQLSLMRFQVFLATEKEFEIQEAERLVRIAHLMQPEDRLTMKSLDEIVFAMAEYNIQEGAYDPDDPRLMDSSLDNVKNLAASKEEIVKFLLSKGMDFFHKGQWWTSERLLNKARLIAINHLGRQDRLTLLARWQHLRISLSLGLFSMQL